MLFDEFDIRQHVDVGLHTAALGQVAPVDADFGHGNCRQVELAHARPGAENGASGAGELAAGLDRLRYFRAWDFGN